MEVDHRGGSRSSAGSGGSPLFGLLLLGTPRAGVAVPTKRPLGPVEGGRRRRRSCACARSFELPLFSFFELSEPIAAATALGALGAAAPSRRRSC